MLPLHRLLPFALPVLATAATMALAVDPATAQDRYKQPPAEMLAILDAPPPPVVSLDPTGNVLLLAQGIAMPSIDDLAAPMLALAGSRIDPGNNGPHNPSRYVTLTLKQVIGGTELDVTLPDAGRVGFPVWAPDGSRLAFAVTHDDGIELWVADASNGRSRKLSERTLNAARGGAFRWMPDSRTLLCRFVVENRGDAPAPPRAPRGPVVQETEAGRKSQVRTYQDLLAGPHDAALFDHYMTAQAALVHVETGARTSIGAAAIFAGLSPSPNGELLLVQRHVGPYSYQVPASRFPRVIEVWNRKGAVVKRLAELPLADEIPIGGVATGMRSVSWMPGRRATLQWMEALDAGDPKVDVAHRDRLLVQDAPFDQRPVEILRTEHRCYSLDWMHNSAYGLAREYDRDRRWIRGWVINPDIDTAVREGAVTADARTRKLFDRSVNDRYGDTGSPLMTDSATGHRVILTTGGHIYLTGAGATPEGDRPFLNRLDVLTLKSEELWRNRGDAYETVVDLLPGREPYDPPRMLTRWENLTTPPNYFVQDYDGSKRTALTDIKDPAPELQGLSKELVTYERDDGVTLTGTLYLPPGHTAGQQHPLLVWAYPREYNDAETAGQVRGSPYRYTRLRGYSHLFMLTQGWAIMDGAAMPVIGDPETVNETFIEQIVASAAAAIDEAVRRGVADRERTAVGGHSYGAFMTANLLAHSDLFKAGIARSGAYNRTLTPFGFQSERRTLWEATDTYVKVSPFLHADKINEPILLTHGELDSNSGTYPLQSERLFHALRGHGATAKLVMLPYESHGYRARESVLHVLAEQAEWLAKYVAGEDEPTP